MQKETKLVALVGMCGAGKSIVSDRFLKAGYSYIRFGQAVLDEVKRRGVLTKTESLEREIREGFRKQYGMAAMAIINLPKFDELLSRGDVIADNMYSWSEYKVLKERYRDRLTIVAVYASPALRYERVAGRSTDVANDPTLRYRSFTPTEAYSRDTSEIENLEKGGPIAMADHTIMNTKDLAYLDEQIAELLRKLSV